MAKHIPLRRLIATHLPTFCWQTTHEILTFIEQIEENVDKYSLTSTLSTLARRGVLEWRPVRRSAETRGIGHWAREYRRVAS